MTIPYEPEVFGIPINVHLILEYLAFFLGYQYYRHLRKGLADPISQTNRLSIILGAILGAIVGSRAIGFIEQGAFEISGPIIWQLVNTKTIMGGLFGGLLGVELAKRLIGERHSSGDLFTFPLILGIFIGRIGCFLTGVKEFTYGKVTTMFTGMDLGDGLLRHPTSLYELVFLILLFVALKILDKKNLESGMIFKLFMINYFGFRFLIEFIKPNEFFICGLSIIQFLCLFCWLYYFSTLKKIVLNAN